VTNHSNLHVDPFVVVPTFHVHSLPGAPGSQLSLYADSLLMSYRLMKGRRVRVALILALGVLILIGGFMSINVEHLYSDVPSETKNTPSDLSPNITNVSSVVETGIATPRAWPSWKRPLPCFQRKSPHTPRPAYARQPYGFLFVKTEKTGSSTASGIALRLARNVAQRQHNNTSAPSCEVAYAHKTCHTQRYENRVIGDSFLWSIIRDPTQRALSEFFHFQASRKGVAVTDENVRKFLMGSKNRNYFLRYLSCHANETEGGFSIVNKILQDYDFLFVTERFDESAVALAMLLGLETSDVLYLAAKANGNYDDGRFQRRCVFIQPKVVSATIKGFLESEMWSNATRYDRALWKAANASLDLTIDQLGRDSFQDELTKFQKTNAVVQSYCTSRVQFPCNATGHRFSQHDCILGDMGCGMDCLDEVVISQQL